MELVRYEQLTDALARMSCRNLVEVGVWNGARARDLISAALRRNPEVTYQGFDLFESLTDAELEQELSKRPPPRAEVERGLREFQARVHRRGRLLPSRRRRFDFALHQGYTRETLPAFREEHPDFRADFVWLDGGHKIETIENDWMHTSRLLAPTGVAFLDDYYGNAKLAEGFGCNRVVERLREDPTWEVEVLPATDTIPEMGTIQVVRVAHAS